MKHTSAPPTVGIVVKRWPRLSETFVLNEILGLERMGLPLRIYALMDPHEPTTQDAVAGVRAPVSYLRSGTRADVFMLLIAQLGLLCRAPWPYLRTLGYVLARRRHTSTFMHFIEAARLALLVRRQGVTHLHAHFAHGPTSVAHFAHLLSGVPFSFTGHAKDIYLSPPDLLAVKIAAARFVTTCTMHNVAYLHTLTAPEERAKVHLIYHGVDTQRFAPAPWPAGMPQPGEESRVPTMIAVGRLVEKKGYPFLIRACALLRERGYRFRLDIYGSGDLKDPLRALIGDLGLPDIVRLRGARTQEELISAYREAALFVLAPHVLDNGDRDGIPNVLMEAMATGLPTVATAVSGIPELIEDGRSGLLVPPQDEEALAGALARLLDPTNGPALCRRLGAGGRARVVEAFAAAIHLRRLLELLNGELPADGGMAVATNALPHARSRR